MPIVLEDVESFPAGAFEIVAVARETSTDTVVSRRIAGRWPEPKDVAEELYLSIYSRRPDADEVALVEAQLKGTKREEALKEQIWAMLAAAEFRFNH